MIFKSRILIFCFLSVILSSWCQPSYSSEREPPLCIAWYLVRHLHFTPITACDRGYSVMIQYCKLYEMLVNTVDEEAILDSTLNKEQDFCDAAEWHTTWQGELNKAQENNSKLPWQHFSRLKTFINTTLENPHAERDFLCKALFPSFIFECMRYGGGNALFDYVMKKFGKKLRSTTPLIQIKNVPLLTPAELIFLTIDAAQYTYETRVVHYPQSSYGTITTNIVKRIPREIAIHMVGRAAYSYIKPHLDRNISAKKHPFFHTTVNFVCREGPKLAARWMWSKISGESIVQQFKFASKPIDRDTK